MRMEVDDFLFVNLPPLDRTGPGSHPPTRTVLRIGIDTELSVKRRLVW
jgi:hypothetical protein